MRNIPRRRGSSDLRDLHPVAGLVFGSASFLGGAAIVLIAAGRIEIDPASVHAPPWVLAVCGAMFALTGVALLYYGILNALGGDRAKRRDGDFPLVPWLLGLVISGGLAAVFSWVALGPGERSFSGSAGFGGVAVGGSGGETVGRIVFGAGAVLAWLIAIWGVIHGLRRLAGGGE